MSQYAADRARKRVSHNSFFWVNKAYSESMTATIMNMSMILRSTLWECCQCAFFFFSSVWKLVHDVRQLKEYKKEASKSLS